MNTKKIGTTFICLCLILVLATSLVGCKDEDIDEDALYYFVEEDEKGNEVKRALEENDPDVMATKELAQSFHELMYKLNANVDQDKATQQMREMVTPSRKDMFANLYTQTINDILSNDAIVSLVDFEVMNIEFLKIDGVTFAAVLCGVEYSVNDTDGTDVELVVLGVKKVEHKYWKVYDYQIIEE